MEFSMRRADRALGEDEALRLVAESSHAVLSTVDADGEPYGVPISFALEGRSVYLHGAAAAGHRLANVGGSCRACLTVVSADEVVPAQFTTHYSSAIAFGMLRPARDDAEKREGLRALVRKYAPDHMEAGERYIDAAIDQTSVLVMEVDRVTGKSNAPGRRRD
jgi:nitroimidazol reductase NimA-like FMN-containing flavoprotein (pyridoxamine 5'-phosphate oxidase superfamily)